MLAAFGLGLLSALALPPLHAIPVLLLAVPGLLTLLGAQAWMRGAAAIGFWFGLGHHLIGLYWITEAILIEAARFWWLVPLAVPALSALLALFIAAPCAIAWRIPAGWPRVLVFAGAWVGFEFLRQYLGTGFPWNPWGSVWAVPGRLGDVALQPMAWVSVHGITLLTILLAATPLLGRRAMAGGAAVLALWAAFGVWRLQTPMLPAPDLQAVLVQGNVAQGQKWDRSLVMAIFDRYLALTRQGMVETKGRRSVVIWPETASPFLLEQDADARAAIMDATGGAPALVGSVRFDAQRRPRNTLMALVNAGAPAAEYDKWHLVPFGEYNPSWMPLPIQVVPGGGFAGGDGPATLRVPGLPPFGPFICYEAIFPAQVVNDADRPEWMVNITNDAWFGNSTGPRQHLAAARMRAVEEGLPLLRAANTGITVAIDPFGRELNRIGMGVAGVMVVAVPGRLPPTPFSRLGLMIPGALALGALAAGLLLARSQSDIQVRIRR